MATRSPQRYTTPDNDELLNGTVNGEDIFDVTNILAPTQPSRPQITTGDDAVGIDEEIKVVKKRTPVPKLDDNRLLSDPGILKLQRISKERLKFKGRGHEYGDMARMLNMYQLWLDDLYPRAKFADGLTMIEKLGHTKRLQMMRKEWIDESKPRHISREEEETRDVSMDEATHEDALGVGALEEGAGQSVEQQPTQNGISDRSVVSDEPDEDELDALLAVEVAPTPPRIRTSTGATVDDDDDPFADAMDVLRDMDEEW